MDGRLHHSHQGFHLHKRLHDTVNLPDSTPLEHLAEQPQSELSPSITRRSKDDQKPYSLTRNPVPVILAIVIPILLIIVGGFYLHRRHVRRLRKEDANDPHKSLDFGWDPSGAPLKGRNKSKKKGPEMSIADVGTGKGSRRERGLSMDLDLPSPYLLPPGLNGSRESLHSMSRTINSQDDRYRPATNCIPNDARSMHSYRTGRKGADDSSSDGSLKRSPGDEMKQDLLGNAQRMSRSMPPVNRSPVPEVRLPEAAKELPRKALPSNPQSAGLSPSFPLLDSRDSYMDNDDAALRKSNNYLGALIHSREPSADLLGQQSQHTAPNGLPSAPSSNLQQTSNRKSPPPTINTTQQQPPRGSSQPANPDVTGSKPPRIQSFRASEQGTYENFFDDASDYGDGVKVTPPSPRGSQPAHHELNRRSSQAFMPQVDEYSLGAENANDVGYDVRRLSMGVRPLPPDDPTDNPEQRANRIRSFYKEYFDDSKPGPVHAAGAGAGGYYEDYDQQYLGDEAIFDPVAGQFVTSRSQQPHNPEQRGRPFAESYGRRAMTPPPRAPPRSGRQHAATLSGGGRMMPPGPRAFSSASDRFGPSGRSTPKKQAPPPMPLNVLPTPHMLKDDNFAIYNSMDFAPPTSARDRQAGRPESPRGGFRPYSPAVSAHMPLQSSFDDLAPMPSPHLLRRSGTFTALDFAPPPRFRGNDTASDAGSIRSTRSGMSAAAAHSVRAGAYRVSRIPKEVVGTRNEINDSLRPQWDLNR